MYKEIETILQNIKFDVMNNKTIQMLTIVISVIFISLYLNIGKNITNTLLQYNLIRLLLFIMLMYVASSNIGLAVLLTIMIFISLQLVIEEHFTTNYHNVGTHPHLKQNPNTIHYDMKLQHPSNINKQEVQKGKKLMLDGIHMKKDHLTDRDHHISNHLINKGRTYAHNYSNRYNNIYNDGYYVNSYIIPDFIEYGVVYDKYLNDIEIMDLLNKIILLFEELQKESVDTTNCNNKMDNIYKYQLDLVDLIFSKKINEISVEQRMYIKNKLELIHSKLNKKESYIDELKEVIQILL